MATAHAVQDVTYCAAHAANCTAVMRKHQIDWLASADEVPEHVRAHPEVYTAAITFGAPDLRAVHDNSRAPDIDADLANVAEPAAAAPQSQLHDLMAYTLHLNRTQLPPTQRFFSDVTPGAAKVEFGPNTDWRKAYLLANLQLAVDRSLLALASQETASGALGAGVDNGEQATSEASSTDESVDKAPPPPPPPLPDVRVTVRAKDDSRIQRVVSTSKVCPACRRFLRNRHASLCKSSHSIVR